ncbi:MAG: type VII secretion target [Pseudonocardia sp.]
MSEGMTVDLEALDGHARAVEAHAERMRQVAEAARPLDPQAYGLIGQAFATTVMGTVAGGSAAIGELARGIEDVAAGVRACRNSYENAEQRHTSAFGGPR